MCIRDRPGVGDDTRSWGPPWTGRSSSYFESVNRSKLSVTLDLAHAEDLDLAHELARRADVVVENFRTGTMERHGLGYQQVAQRNPGVVYVSITGFGSDAGASLPGYDFVVQAVGGLMSITGRADGPPQKVGVALVERRRLVVRRARVEGDATRRDLQLEVAGFGMDQPVEPNEVNGEDNPEGRALNRRVEIRFSG